MVRGILGVVAGAILWMATFLILAGTTARLWPEYGVHARAYRNAEVFIFTSLTASFNLLFWAIAAIGAGWLAMKIAKRREAVWVLATVIGIYVVALHLVLYWPRFPWWYNLGVVIPAIPGVLLGAKLAASSHSVVSKAA